MRTRADVSRLSPSTAYRRRALSKSPLSEGSENNHRMECVYALTCHFEATAASSSKKLEEENG